MSSSRLKRRLAGLMLAGLSGLNSGCNPNDLVVGPVSFALGAWFASQFRTTSVEYRCFRDGTEVDCSTLTNFVESPS